MSKKTYKKGVDIVMVDGEINILSPGGFLLYSSRNKTGVKQLDRQRFVKPIDVEALALNKTLQLDFKGRDAVLYSEGIIEGYKANKGVYTEEQMRQALTAIRNHKNMSIDDVTNNLNPLSLPESVTIENDEIIEVVW